MQHDLLPVRHLQQQAVSHNNPQILQMTMFVSFTEKLVRLREAVDSPSLEEPQAGLHGAVGSLTSCLTQPLCQGLGNDGPSNSSHAVTPQFSRMPGLQYCREKFVLIKPPVSIGYVGGVR